MSKQANRTLIGAFVLGAILLTTVAVMVFGSGKFFKQTKKYVLFFEGSVNGLQVGSPVMLRGVKIGEVTDIAMEFNEQDLSVRIPVYIEIDPKKMKLTGETGWAGFKRDGFIKPLIEKGLKAQLQMQSFVTGQLIVSLDFYPNRPIRLSGAKGISYPEIPTIPTTTQELQKQIEELPLKEIVAKLDKTLSGIEKLVNSPDVEGSFASLNQLLKSTDRVVSSPNIQESISSLNQLIKNLDRLVAQNENLSYQTGKTLEEVSRLSRSLRSLTDYLDRHPEALIKGKRPAKED